MFLSKYIEHWNKNGRYRAVALSSDTMTTEKFNCVRVLAIVRSLYKFTGESSLLSKTRNCLNCFFDCTRIYYPTNSNRNTNAIIKIK